MRIEEIYLDGFGIFHQYHIIGIPSGITVLYGPNESGKSTLLAFIQQVLFGFPDGRSRKIQYLPLAGGNHGGRIRVRLHNGEVYGIERYGGRREGVQLFLSDGRLGGSQELSHLLGHIKQEVFENIYAFSLSELQDIKTLHSDEMRERMYSAGRGIGEVSIEEAKTFLSNESSNLFTLKGRKPFINNLLKSLKEKEEKIREESKSLERFNILYHEKEELKKELDIAIKDQEYYEKKEVHVEKLLAVWESWVVMQEATRAYNAISAPESFPEEGKERMEGILATISGYEDRILEIKGTLKSLEEQRVSLTIDESLLQYKGEILSLQRGIEKYESALHDLPEIEALVRKEEAQLQESLSEIGRSWTEEKMMEVDRSIPVKEGVRKRSDEMEEIRRNLRDQGIEKNQRIAEREDLEKEKLLLHEELDTKRLEARNETDVGEEQKALLDIRSLLGKKEVIVDDLQNLYTLLDTKKNERENLSHQEGIEEEIEEEFLSSRSHLFFSVRQNLSILKELKRKVEVLAEKEELVRFLQPDRANALSFSWEILRVFAVIFIGIGGVLFLMKGNVPKVGIGILLFFLLLAGVVWMVQRKERTRKKKVLQKKEVYPNYMNFAEEKERLEGEISQIQSTILSLVKEAGLGEIPSKEWLNEREEAWKNLKTLFLQEIDLKKKIFLKEEEKRKIENDLLVCGERAGIEGIPNLSTTNEREEILKKEEKSLNRKKILEEKIKDIDRKMLGVESRESMIEERISSLQKDEEELQGSWMEWKKRRGFDSQLSPEGVLEVFTKIEESSVRKEKKEEIKARKEKIKKEITVYEEECNAVYAGCGRDKESDNYVSAAESLVDGLRECEEKKKMKEGIEREEENAKRDKKIVEEKLRNEKKKQSLLFKEGFADSEEEFRNNAREWETRRKYAYDIEQGRGNIRVVFGEQKYEEVVRELSETDHETLLLDQKQIEQRREEAQEKYSQCKEKIGEIDGQIAQIEKNKEASQLKMEQAVDMEILQRKAEEWAVAILSQLVIEKTIEKYERQRQPDIIKKAQSLFASITAGRYPSLYIAADTKKEICVEETNRSRKSISQLSRGTAEQLYLSLRLGFIQDFSSYSEPLPLIFDDILVNFDHERVQNVCSLLRDFAQEHQILYFTCHKSTKELMEGVGAHIISIGEGVSG
ncbi:MAG: AAA family ATPase [Candidatus Ratteibacteria bacterium]|jgi:uncharacterized protein YhaN